MKRNNKTWIRQLSEAYIRLNELSRTWQGVPEEAFEAHHEELRKTGTTSFHYMSSPHVEHFGLKPDKTSGGWETERFIEHPKHGTIQVERSGDMYHLSKLNRG